jgi:hypothetical protein
MFVVLTNKFGRLTVTQTNAFINNSQHISAQTGHHQVILEEYANNDGTNIKYNASINFC